MNRYNLFEHIYRGLRALLNDTRLLLQQTDFRKDEKTKETLNRIQMVISCFEVCQKAEDACILPFLLTYEPGVADALAQDHTELSRLAQLTKNCLNGFRHARPPKEQQTSGKRTVAAFENFTLFLNGHMNREERLANQLLWRYCNDAELQLMARRIVTSTEPVFSMTDDKRRTASPLNSRLTNWVSEANLKAPEMIFKPLVQSDGTERLVGHWNRVQERMAYDPPLAN